MTGVHVSLRSVSCTLQLESKVIFLDGRGSSVSPFGTESSCRHISITKIDFPSLGSAPPDATKETRRFGKVLPLPLQPCASCAESLPVLIGLVEVWAFLRVVLGRSPVSARRGIFGTASDEVVLVTALGILGIYDSTHVFSFVMCVLVSFYLPDVFRVLGVLGVLVYCYRCR